jgi:NAD kinase
VFLVYHKHSGTSEIVYFTNIGIDGCSMMTLMADGLLVSTLVLSP